VIKQVRIGSSAVIGVLGLALAAVPAWAASPSPTSSPASTPPARAAASAAWRQVSIPASGAGTTSLTGVAGTSPSDVWVVGSRTVAATGQVRAVSEHFDGARWTVVTPPQPGTGQDMLVGVSVSSPTQVWAVGNWLSGDTGGQLLLHSTGGQWTATRPPDAVGDLHAVRALSGSDVWAVGDVLNSHGVLQPYAEHWDGVRWTRVSMPDPNPYVGAILTAISGTSRDLWAVGSGDRGTLTMHFDGTRWSLVAAPGPGNYDNVLYGVTVLSPRDIWAVGDQVYADPNAGLRLAPLIEHWDGSRWQATAVPRDPASDHALDAVAPDGAGGLWAVGLTRPFPAVNPATALIEHGDQRSWKAVPTPDPGGTDTELAAVATIGASSWAVGQATTRPAGEVLRNG